MAIINGTAGDNTLAGTSSNDTISGLGGNDTLGGSVGTDILIGGIGNDTYIVNSSGDVTTEAAKAGTDTVQASLSWTLAANVENLTLSGSANFSGTGNGLANIITGNSGNNVLTGNGGNDTLNGGAGSDTAAYAGNSAGYEIKLVDGALQITDIDSSDGDTGTDALNSIEKLSFSDGTVSLDYAYINGEIPVDTQGSNSSPAISKIQNGGFVVVWETRDQDEHSDGYGVYGQRYDANGNAIGAEIQVYSDIPNNNYEPAVAGLADGGFVVSWCSDESSGDNNYGILAQRYDLNGAPVGELFVVNTITDGSQTAPRITALPDGGFVITWTDNSNDGNGYGIYARHFDAAGAATGDQFLVNETVSGNQSDPGISAFSDGGFIFAWNDHSGGIFLRRYDSAGNPVGGEITVADADGNWDARVATAADGGFAVCWEYGDAIHMQRYDAGGIPSSVITVASDISNSSSTITGLSGGGFVVSWTSQDDVYARIYDAAGTPQDDAFVVNTYTTSLQIRPSITALADGSFVIAWESWNQVESGSEGVYARHYAADGTIVGLRGDGGNNTLSFDGGPVRMTGGGGNDTYVVSHSRSKTVEAANAGTDTVKSSIDWTLGDNIENLTLTGSSDIDGTGNSLGNIMRGNTGDNVLDGGQGDDVAFYEGTMADYSISVSRDGTMQVVSDATGDDTLINIEALRFSDGTYSIDTVHEDRVNTTTAGDQTAPQTSSLNSGASAGGHVVTWGSYNPTGDVYDIYAQMYDASGNPVNGEILVNTTGTANVQSSPSITTLADGSFIVTWQSDHDELGNYEIYGQRFSDEGLPQGEFIVNSETASTQSGASASALAGGGFVVTWISADTDGTSANVYARVFDSTNTPLDSQFLVTTTTAGLQYAPVVAGLADGKIAFVWTNGNPGDIYGNIFENGVAVGEFLISNPTTADQQDASITALNNGGFVVTWSAYNEDGTDWDVRAQLCGADGSLIGDSFIVNTTTADTQRGQSIAALTDGGFMVAWESYGENGYDIHAQRYDANGNAVGREFLVNTTTDLSQRSATVTGMDDGRFAITWESEQTDGSFDIYSQYYNADGTLGYIEGDSGNNTLGYKFGPAKLIGGTGNDTYVVHGNDVLVESASAGTDTVKVGFDWTLADNFENLVLSGGDAANGTGNSASNALTGNGANNILSGLGGNDTLNGGAGIDTLIGGLGNDTYTIGTTTDTLVENASQGTDTVKSSVTWTLGSNFENLVLTGSAALTGNGNTLANALTGNTGANTLNGSSGNDILNGGAGKDKLTGGSGLDKFVFSNALSASTNLDTITDFKAADDTIQLENAIFKKLTKVGVLSSSNFKTGKAADVNDYIVYETDTGKLFYDADGSGKGAAVQFATLVGHPDNVTYKDFSVI